MSNTLQDIAEVIEALTDPHHHAEPRYDEDGKPTKPHITVVRGLIEQLRTEAEPGNDGGQGGTGGRESVPVAIDAVSLLGAIEYGAARRLASAIERGARVERRQGAEDCLRALVGIAGQFPHSRTRVDPYLCPGCVTRARPTDPADDPYWAEFIARATSRNNLTPAQVDALLVEARQECAPAQVELEHWAPCHHCEPTVQKELLSEVRSWMWQAEIITGWRIPPRLLPAPCMVCDAKGTLLAYADPANPQARCTGCGTQWAQDCDEEIRPIGLLADHVRAYAGRTEEERRRARAEAVAQRRRRDGEPERDTQEGTAAA